MNCIITFLVATALTGFIPTGNTQLKSLKSLGEWKELEYEFPSATDRQYTLISGEYVPGNGVPIDVDIDYRADQGRSRVFVTIPRFTSGIPITLGILSGQHGPGGPIIRAFPDYGWHNNQGNNCDGMTSVFRVAIDECQRLWVVDTGRIAENQMCPPQILVFNLNTNELIHRYKFPLSQYRSGMSLFVTPVVDVRDPPPMGQCINTMVYIADVTGFSIMVYDMRKNKSWRVQNKLVFPHPHYGTFTIAGETFDLMDGVLGLALSPKSQSLPYLAQSNYINGAPESQSERSLYFHALASITENIVPVNLLDNSTAWETNPDSEPRKFVEIGNRGTQSAAQAMDSNGNLFFGLMNPIAIACWDSTKPYGRDNMKIVVQNDDTLQFASGMKVVVNKNGKEELWVLTCRFQRIMTGRISNQEVNFRIQALQIDELLDGKTRCSAAGVPTSNFAFPRY